MSSEHDARAYSDSAFGVWSQLWYDQALVGRVWLPPHIDDGWARALCVALNDLNARLVSPVEIIVDCKGGLGLSFEPCKLLLERRRAELDTIATVRGQACSVALSYVVVANHRRATSDARFMVHGEDLRVGVRHESGEYLEDHYVADWLARFSKPSYDDWLDLVRDGHEHWFDARQALDWGVIDEILEGV